jgi:hypothetical protein
MKQIQSYTYTIPANGSVQIPAPNDNFIVQAATGPVTVRGDTFGTLPNLLAGQGLKSVPFSRLELKDESGAPNTVTVLMSPAEFVNQVFSGSVVIVGALALDAPTINSLNRPELPSGAWVNNATAVANTPLTVFAPGANVNGAVVWQASAVDAVASVAHQVFIAKASAPATVIDGEVIAQSLVTAVTPGVNVIVGIDLCNPRRIAPGLGLYFISGLAGTSAMMRSARYTLL